MCSTVVQPASRCSATEKSAHARIASAVSAAPLGGRMSIRLVDQNCRRSLSSPSDLSAGDSFRCAGVLMNPGVMTAVVSTVRSTSSGQPRPTCTIRSSSTTTHPSRSSRCPGSAASLLYETIHGALYRVRMGPPAESDERSSHLMVNRPAVRVRSRPRPQIGQLTDVSICKLQHHFSCKRTSSQCTSSQRISRRPRRSPMITRAPIRPTDLHSRRHRLTAGPAAAAEARDQVRAAIKTWNVPVDPDVAVLLTSELVTNAIRYESGAVVTLFITCTYGHLRVDVHDTSRFFPTML